MKVCVVLVTVLLSSLIGTRGYKLDPNEGNAEIGAYHLQPGRCAGVEARLGHSKYSTFFSWSPFHTRFDELGDGKDVEQMDSTALCANNPALMKGYGGGLSSFRLYLVYGRCMYGTNDMRVMCGSLSAHGRPSKSIFNLVQASCPAGTRCKNLCATMRNPALTSPFAAKQVQLAQCMPIDQWNKLGYLYHPHVSSLKLASTTAPTAASDTKAGSDSKIVDTPAKEDAKVVNRLGGLSPVAVDPKVIVDSKVVDKSPPKKATEDPTHVDEDGSIARHVVPTLGDYAVASQEHADVEKVRDAAQKKDETQPGSDAQTKSVDTQSSVRAVPHQLTHQNAPNDMGFRKRHLSHRPTRHDLIH